jgi:hypothetical protein
VPSQDPRPESEAYVRVQMPLEFGPEQDLTCVFPKISM